MTEDEVLQRINRALPQGAQASPAGSATPVSVGTILKCYGDVQVVRHGGRGSRKADWGMAVYRGESVATLGKTSACSVTLRLNDGTEMFLCENAFVAFVDF
jgi:hypothetical protein